MMDIVVILEKLGSLGFIRLNRIINNYYQIYCPFHSDGNERKPSCGVLLNEEHRNRQKYPQGWVHCFTCGYVNTLPGMIIDILKAHSIIKAGTDWLIENIPGFEVTDNFEFLIPKELMSTLNDKFAVNYIQSLTNPQQRFVTEAELASYRFTVPYMYERKLNDEVIEKFDVGVDMNWIAPGGKRSIPCITFPVRDKRGNTLFICRRSIEGKFFNCPAGVQKPVYGIYELPKNCKSVVITESCFNALTCWVYGRPGVALLGTGNSHQIQQLRELGVQEFILGFDPDEAGRHAAAKLKKALRDVAIVWTFDGIPPEKDLNDLSKAEFNALKLV